MKPSEILGIIDVNKKSDTRVFMLDKKALLMLDTKCIDREELKNKINNEFELHRTIFKHKAIFTEKGFNNLKKKISDLIDKC